MEKTTRKCCGGMVHSKGYSTEPELIDLKPFKTEPTLRHEQNQKLNDKYKVTCKQIEAKLNKQRRHAVLTPLFKLLEHMDHTDPKNADIIANIKNQLATLAKDPAKVEIRPEITPAVAESSETVGRKASRQISPSSRQLSAFRLGSAQNSPSTPSRSPSTPRILPRAMSLSPDSFTLEDESELDSARGTGCDELFNYILGMIKSIIPQHTREEIEKLEMRSAEPVATHNHPPQQRCSPSCWAYDAMDLTRTHNYLTEPSAPSPLQQPNTREATPATMTLPNTGYVTTSMRVPLEYAQY